MNRTYRLAFCKRCKNKAFNNQKGIICSLTNQQADFEQNCENFIEVEGDIGSISSKSAGLNTFNSQSSFKTFLTVYMTTLYVGMAFLVFGLAFLNHFLGIFFFIGASMSFLVSSIYMLMLIHKVWERIIYEAKLNGIECPVESPGKAVGYLFIPFFNFYWIFVVFRNLPITLNNILEARNLKEQLPQELGILVSILVVLGTIPFLGIVLGLTNSLVFIPTLLNRTISTLENLPSPSEAFAKKATSEVDSLEKVSDIREFTEAFQRFNLGINFKLILTIVTGIMLASILYNLFEYGEESFKWEKIEHIVFSIIYHSISIFFFVILFRSIKNIHALVFAFAITQASLSGLGVLFYRLFGNHYGSFELVDIFSLSTMASSFFYGISFMYLVVFGVRYFGMTFWVLIVGAVLAGTVSSLIWHFWAVISNFEWYKFSIKNQLVSFGYSVVYGLAFYFGIWWYLLPVFSKYKYKKTNSEMLDSNLN